MSRIGILPTVNPSGPVEPAGPVDHTLSGVLVAPGRARSRTAVTTGRKIALGAVLPVAIIIGWDLVVRSGVFPSALIPGPGRVAQALWSWFPFSGASDMFYSGHLFTDVGATSLRVLIGFAVAAAIGVVLGILIGVSAVTDELFSPLVRILGPVPPTTWIPVAIVVIGLGEMTNDFLTFLGAVFPILASTSAATMSVNRDLLRAGRMLGDSRTRLLVSVVFPAALPGIVSGLRLGIGISWMMAVTSEMLAVHDGLGYTLWNAYNYLDYPGVFAAMIVIGVCGFASDGALRTATKRVLKWQTDTGVREK